MTDAGITTSRFMMWRAIFALAHADGIVTPEENTFMRDALEAHNFSGHQRRILENDISQKQDVGQMFAGIIDHKDRSDFFTFARLIVWCDGDFDEQERIILTQLKQTHIQSIDFDSMVKEVQLAFDESEKDRMKERMRMMYADLQKDKKDEKGGMFGAVIRKMMSDN